MNDEHGKRRGLAGRLSRRKWIALGLVLALAGTAIAALYASNKVTTTITPTGGLTLTGNFGTGYVVGSPKVTTWSVKNDAGASVTAYLELNVTKPGGGAASDVTVNFGATDVTPVCGGTPVVCTYTSTTTLIAPGATISKDVSLKFNVAASFTVSLQALGN